MPDSIVRNSVSVCVEDHSARQTCKKVRIGSEYQKCCPNQMSLHYVDNPEWYIDIELKKITFITSHTRRRIYEVTSVFCFYGRHTTFNFTLLYFTLLYFTYISSKAINNYCLNPSILQSNIYIYIYIYIYMRMRACVCVCVWCVRMCVCACALASVCACVCVCVCVL